MILKSEKIMKVRFTKVAAIFAAFLSLIVISLSSLVHADTNSDSSFSVTTNLNKYQRNDKVSYFDLLMGPGEKTILSINIINNDDITQHYTASINRAVTNINTIIDYSQTTSTDMIGLNENFDLRRMVTPQDQKVTIAGHQKKEVQFEVTMPKEVLKGVLLGGVYVRQEVESKVSNGYTNRFNFVTTLLVRQLNDLVKADLNLNKVSVKADNVGVINANISNKTSAYLTDLTTTGSLFKSDEQDKALVMSKQKSRSIAPNTNFDYQLPVGNKKIKPGRYILDLTIVSKKTNQTWHWRETLTISDKDTKAISLVTGYHIPTPWWVWLLIGLGCLLVLLFLLILWLLIKRRKSKEEFERDS